MNQMMDGMMGGMWLWTAVGTAMLVFVIVAIVKMLQKK